MRNLAIALSLAAATALGVAACGGHSDSGMVSMSNMSVPTAGKYKTTTLVSDGSVTAANIDVNLKNGWGIVFNPTGFVWVSDNATQKSTLYDGNGVPQSLVVTIPPAASGQAAGPTGIVFNSSADFIVHANGFSGPAVFLWATEAGTIAGWSPKVLATQAITAHDDGVGGAVYKGLAIASNNGANLLYAADFHNAKVDVFNTTFAKVQLAGNFSDPGMPSGMAPFGIQTIGTTIYVTFAKLGADGRTQVNGAGNGVSNQPTNTLFFAAGPTPTTGVYGRIDAL